MTENTTRPSNVMEHVEPRQPTVGGESQASEGIGLTTATKKKKNVAAEARDWIHGSHSSRAVVHALFQPDTSYKEGVQGGSKTADGGIFRRIRNIKASKLTRKVFSRWMLLAYWCWRWVCIFNSIEVDSRLLTINRLLQFFFDKSTVVGFFFWEVDSIKCGQLLKP
jgi:hypothetical protein